MVLKSKVKREGVGLLWENRVWFGGILNIMYWYKDIQRCPIKSTMKTRFKVHSFNKHILNVPELLEKTLTETAHLGQPPW